MGCEVLARVTTSNPAAPMAYSFNHTTADSCSFLNAGAAVVSLLAIQDLSMGFEP